MLEELQIRNYRIFKELKIDQLRRINLIAGNNNSGKTSLLEAIFLLSGGGNVSLLKNAHVARVDPGAIVQGDSFWRAIFSDLDLDKRIEIQVPHSSYGQLSLEITWRREPTDEISIDSNSGDSISNLTTELSIQVIYRGPQGSVIKSRLYAEGNEVKVEQPSYKVPFNATLLKSGGSNSQEDAMRLAKLRKRKLDHLLLEALQVVEPRLLSIEENSSSGTSMIWGDIGLSELVPLAIMGEGMTRIARLVLVISDSPNGVVLLDEVENGIHHSVLAKVWHAIDAAAKQSNTQVFATTHSLECVRAAHESLDSDDFRLHRIEAKKGTSRCITYDPESIAAAIKFNFEVR